MVRLWFFMTLFTLQVRELTNLGQDRAVEFFRRLLWAEAGRVGVGKHLINVPDCINVGDGGIDAIIENAVPSNDEVIPTGTSGFQIKSSDLFPSHCKKELHVSEDLNKPLKPEIKRLLDNNGTYVLVLFADITNQAIYERREKAIREELKKCGYNNAKVRFYTANQLIGYAEHFIGLITWFKNYIAQCLSYSSWAENHDVKIPRYFVFDKERKQWMDSIRKKLRESGDKCLIFRITSLSGIGKTRFVFETLSPDDFKNRVIYVRAEAFKRTDLYTYLLNDQNLHAIIVIDECDLQQHDEFVRSFASRGSRIVVFTISYDLSKVPAPAYHFPLNPLDKQNINELIRVNETQLPNNVIDRISDFSGGYPRIAVLLVESYLAADTSPEDFLRIKDEALLDRLIGGRYSIGSGQFIKIKKILQGVSLFSKLGYSEGLDREAKWVTNLVGIGWNEFQELIAEQRRRGIIQGQHYIYVTPFMLRVHLINEWWEAHGFTKEGFNAFIESIPIIFRADILERFFDSIPYITTIDRGKIFVKEVLSKHGLFADESLLKTQLGSVFFLKLAEADAESALACLKRTIGVQNKEQLLQFSTGRREVVWALERIAMWKNLFPDAARLLLSLGEAENETWGNNASGVFAGLFTTAPAPVAPTEASPQERFPILKEALESESKGKRELALKACDHALETQNFRRLVGAEYQGLRKEPRLWKPKIYGELFDAYKSVWKLLYKQLDILRGDEKQRIINILLRRSRGLLLNPNLADMVIETFKKLIYGSYIERESILAEIIKILRYDNKDLAPEIKEQLGKLKDNLSGADFSSLLKRYVGMNLLEDRYDEEGNPIDDTQVQIKKLARLAIENKNLLWQELNWIMSTAAKNGFQFGYELSYLDQDLTLLPRLLETLRQVGEKGSALFLGGYFRVIFEREKQKWEKLLDDLAEDENLNYWIPELTWRSGISDQAALRILNLAKKGKIEPSHFRLFAWGGVIQNLSENVFKKWVQWLVVNSKDDAIDVVLDLYYFFYFGDDPKYKMPERLTLTLLTHPTLLKISEFKRNEQMSIHHWTEIGKAFIRIYPERSTEISLFMLEHFGEDNTIFQGFFSPVKAVVYQVLEKFPGEVWEQASKHLGPPIDSRAFHIKEWLREGALNKVPLRKIWDWVDSDINDRAWYLATFVPKILNKDSLARKLLIRYGVREDVRNNLLANFETEAWTGQASLHFKRNKQILLDFKKGEDNEKVKRWIDEYISTLDSQIRRAEIEEERRDIK